MDEDQLSATAAKAAQALRAAGVPFALGGGCAVYAHGGPVSEHDVDIFLAERDVVPARHALVEAGMRAADAPHDWLAKAYDGPCLVDLIHRPNRRPVTDELLNRAVPRRLGDTVVPVLPATDVVIDKILVLNPERCDFTPLLPILAALREQVDWAAVRTATEHSPYARALLWLAAETGLVPEAATLAPTVGAQRGE
ncbi:hypothetical protein GCM10025762_26230 [Haloechinothrix salitolerans]